MTQQLVTVSDVRHALTESGNVIDALHALRFLVRKHGPRLRAMPASLRQDVFDILTQGQYEDLVQEQTWSVKGGYDDSLGQLGEAFAAIGIPLVTLASEITNYCDIGKKLLHYFRIGATPLGWYSVCRSDDIVHPLTAVRIKEAKISDGSGEFAVFALDWPVAVLVQRDCADHATGTIRRTTYFKLVPRGFMLLYFGTAATFEQSYRDHLEVVGAEIRFNRRQLPVSVVPAVCASMVTDVQLSRQRIFFRSSLDAGVISCCRNT